MDPIVLLFLVLVSTQSLAALGWWVSADLLRVSRHASRHWSVFGAAGLAASLAGAFNSRLPGPWPAALAQFFLLLGLVALARGLAVFFRRPPADLPYVLLLAVAAALGILDIIRGLPPHLRVALISLALAGVLLHAVALTWRAARAEFGGVAASLAVLPLLAGAVLFGTRAGRLLLGRVPEGSVPLTSSGLANQLMLLGLCLLVIILHLLLAYMVMARMVRRLQDLSQRDALTGLLSRRELMRRIEDQQRWHQRSGQVHALVMVDIDHFKRVNDTRGHAAGDQALVAVAQCLQAASREVDSAGRLGGEEFCLLMPQTGLAEAAAAAERVRARIQALDIALGGEPVRLTASFGVAAIVDADRGSDDLLRRADAALYRAKAAGRNRVECAG